MKLTDPFLDLISRSLRLEVFSGARTLLEPHHCPKEFTIRGLHELNLYKAGRMTYEIQGKDEEELPEGIPIYLPAGIPMRMRNLNMGKTISVWHAFRFSVLETIDPLQLLNIPTTFPKSLGDAVDQISRDLVINQSESNENFFCSVVQKHELGIRLFQLLLTVAQIRPNAIEVLTCHERIQPVLNHLQRDFQKPFRIGELAAMLNVSEPRFFELFRKATSMSTGQYLKHIRMRKAQELLMRADLQVKEVATRVGYEDPFHFSRQFRKYVGICPERFLAQFRSPKNHGSFI